MPSAPAAHAPAPASKDNSARLVPYRSLGLVCSNTPVAINSLGTNAFFTAVAPLEKSFQLFNVENLHLILVSNEIPSKENISCVATHNETTFAAAGTQIFIFQRAVITGVLSLPPFEPVRSVNAGETMETDGVESFNFFKLLVLGNLILGALSDNTIRIWNWKTKDYVKTMSFDAHFEITTFIHPSAYLNKIVVASSDGRLQLWNFESLTMLHEFPSLSCAITALAQSPALDVLAIGTQDGRVILKNIKTNTPIRLCVHSSGSAAASVIAISFRSDDAPTASAMMATAGADGTVCVWDLSKGALAARVSSSANRDAHFDAVHTCEFLPGQPVLVTASGDNSIKEWIFDGASADAGGIVRLWKSRSGHRVPPSRVRFVGPDPNTVLTCGADGSLRKYSTVQDQRNLEFSQNNAESRKFSSSTESGVPNEIIHFDACDSGNNDWDDIVTVESNNAVVKTWKLKRGAIGKHLLTTTDKSAAKTACISPCGNFAFIGSALGGIDMYNMQSGRLKRTFPKADGHKKMITGLAVDSLSKILISVSLDGALKVWDIKSGRHQYTLIMSAPVSQLAYHKETCLAALAMDNLQVHIVDTAATPPRVVRIIQPSHTRILDISLSPDARQLATATQDARIRVWDVPTAARVAALRVPQDLAAGVAFSADGLYVASVHVARRGVQLWANASAFGISADAARARLLTDAASDADGSDDDQDDDEGDAGDARHRMETEDPGFDVNGHLIRLSPLPLSRVQLILNLETIQKRKRPSEKLKKPDNIPFFLGALASTTGSMASLNPVDATVVEAASAVSKQTLVDFNSLNAPADWHGKLEYLDSLVGLSPSALDFEIRSQGAADYGAFVELLLASLDEPKNYEFVQSVLGVFLDAHGADIVATQNLGHGLQDKIDRLRIRLEESWRVLEDLFHANLAVLDFLR
ncbi:hypothetical protein HDU83_003771 [Entophlyctis luteolus]|nr:hypothetical protein HDU83_003771 [Entophlyctis luteolus]